MITSSFFDFFAISRNNWLDFLGRDAKTTTKDRAGAYCQQPYGLDCNELTCVSVYGDGRPVLERGRVGWGYARAFEYVYQTIAQGHHFTVRIGNDGAVFGGDQRLAPRFTRVPVRESVASDRC